MWLQQLHDDEGDRSFLDVSTSPSLFSSNNPNNTTTKIASDIDIIQPISSVESTTRTSNIKNNTRVKNISDQTKKPKKKIHRFFSNFNEVNR